MNNWDFYAKPVIERDDFVSSETLKKKHNINNILTDCLY